MPILFILYPIPNILVSILVIVCPFAMLLSIQPVPFIPLPVGISVNAKSIFPILVPLPIIDGSTFVMIDSSSIFLAIEELALVFLSCGIDVESLCIKLIVFPIPHVDVFVGEGVDSLSASTILVLPNVFSPVRVRDFLVLGFKTA